MSLRKVQLNSEQKTRNEINTNPALNNIPAKPE